MYRHIQHDISDNVRHGMFSCIPHSKNTAGGLIHPRKIPWNSVFDQLKSTISGTLWSLRKNSTVNSGLLIPPWYYSIQIIENATNDPMMIFLCSRTQISPHHSHSLYPGY